MYKILSSHRSATPLAEKKEFCARRYGGDDKRYLREVHELILATGELKTVNGCLVVAEAQRFSALAVQSRSKFIVMLRDPPSLMWAAYNFWAIATVDKGDFKAGSWTNSEMVRSPELFHDIIESNFFHVDKTAATSDLRGAVGAENVLFVRSEDMAEKPDEFIAKLSAFTGLDVEGFDPKLIATRTNCGEKFSDRGETTSCEGVGGEGLYAVSGFRPILDKTKKLIYERWADDCARWKAEYGIVYNDCVK